MSADPPQWIQDLYSKAMGSGSSSRYCARIYSKASATGYSESPGGQAWPATSISLLMSATEYSEYFNSRGVPSKGMPPPETAITSGSAFAPDPPDMTAIMLMMMQQ
jgi:hypothetical protein